MPVLNWPQGVKLWGSGGIVIPKLDICRQKSVFGQPCSLPLWRHGKSQVAGCTKPVSSRWRRKKLMRRLKIEFPSFLIKIHHDATGSDACSGRCHEHWNAVWGPTYSYYFMSKISFWIRRTVYQSKLIQTANHWRRRRLYRNQNKASKNHRGLLD